MTVHTAKSEATRALLVETALRLFREQGYDKTTMRAIASAAGVSTGNAYYYFSSKDDLVQELYLSLQDEHRSASLPLLREGQNLGEHLRAILHCGIDVMAPYHEFGSNFISVAIQPASDANPFSRDSAVARAKSIALFNHAVTTARPQPPMAIRADLPELLWLVYMGVTLFWVYDKSPGQQRTRRLIDNAAPLIAKLVILSRLPVVRKIVDDVVQLIKNAKR
ncbi:TetR family transcriptional regulator [Arthrobacter sp. JZ12]|uniref:TetR/AcrR family transcriptional regulator n=1 Tax=Arthrobacter sp. JZ12 TaxID=2654190 RepID=UPI002B493260|nr:TetR family transcriptional regulator [Arthrobacter sp. JZ12]WRH23941.1 TetR family transcriptional regulator [Arthrobacter sp. JZ12]